MSAVTSPSTPLHHRVLHALLQVLQHALRQAQAHMPPYAGPAALAFTVGCGVAAAYMHSGRRRWTPQHMRLHRATALLKECCRDCWEEVDAEGTGWLEVAEARAVLDRVLQVLGARTAQLAALIAPPSTDDSSSATAPSSSSAAASAVSPSSSATAAATAAAASIAASSGSVALAAPDVEAEVRAALGRLFPSLRRGLSRDFKYLLEQLEARPSAHTNSKAMRGFTPPSNHRSPAAGPAMSGLGAPHHSHSHSHSMNNQHRKVSSSSLSSAASSSSSSSLSAAAAASSPSPPLDAAAPPDASSTPTAAAAVASSGRRSSSSSSPAASAVVFDRRIFRCEFLTALVIWLESQIMLQMCNSEQSGERDGR